MLAKAHVTIGMAAAFTIVRPETVAEALPVIVGGALGCLICDLDCEVTTEKTESSRWRKVMAVIAIAGLIEDYLMNAGMWSSLGRNGPYLWFIGLMVFALTAGFASVANHRGFSHSLLAMLIFTVSIWLIFPAAAMPFAVSFATHIVLDLMNKKPVRIFYPMKKGFSLGMFYADRFADKVIALAGSVWLIAAVVFSLRR